MHHCNKYKVDGETIVAVPSPPPPEHGTARTCPPAMPAAAMTQGPPLPLDEGLSENSEEGECCNVAQDLAIVLARKEQARILVAQWRHMRRDMGVQLAILVLAAATAVGSVVLRGRDGDAVEWIRALRAARARTLWFGCAAVAAVCCGVLQWQRACTRAWCTGSVVQVLCVPVGVVVGTLVDVDNRARCVAAAAFALAAALADVVWNPSRTCGHALCEQQMLTGLVAQRRRRAQVVLPLHIPTSPRHLRRHPAPCRRWLLCSRSAWGAQGVQWLLRTCVLAACVHWAAVVPLRHAPAAWIAAALSTELPRGASLVWLARCVLCGALLRATLVRALA
jgi:hypothetical protein